MVGARRAAWPVVLAGLALAGPAAAGPVIIDDGDPGTSSTGAWLTSVAAGFHGTHSSYSSGAGASYAFEAVSPGRYDVSLWWNQASNRCTAAQVQVLDGEVLLDSLTVNQQEDGGRWNLLGDHGLLQPGTRAVITSRGGCVTVADAVRLAPRGPASSPVADAGITRR